MPTDCHCRFGPRFAGASREPRELGRGYAFGRLFDGFVLRIQLIFGNNWQFFGLPELPQSMTLLIESDIYRQEGSVSTISQLTRESETVLRPALPVLKTVGWSR